MLTLKKVTGCPILLVSRRTGGADPMTNTKDTTFFEMKLLEFHSAEDPMLAMLEWMTARLMELEIEDRCNAPKGAHEEARTAYRSGYRTRTFNTRLGTLYMLVPKLRNGGGTSLFSLSSVPGRTVTFSTSLRRCFLGPFNNNINNNKKSSYPLHTLVSPPRQGRLLHLLYLLPEHKGSSVSLHQEDSL